MTYIPNQKPRKKRHISKLKLMNATSEVREYLSQVAILYIHLEERFINIFMVARRGYGQEEAPSLVCPKSSRRGFLSHECSDEYQTGATSAELLGPVPSGQIVYRQK